MYKIYAGGLCIHDDTLPLQEYKVISPKLSLADNSAGTLTLTIPPTNVGYNSVDRLTTEFIVTQDGTEIWRGRALTERTNFWKCRELTCEGELAYLNDTIQPPADYYPESGQKWTALLVKSMLESIISNHNSSLSQNDPIDKAFTVGNVDVSDTSAGEDVHRYTNYETTLGAISEKLVNNIGGHLKIRKENGVRYLDYKVGYNAVSSSTQTIEFGRNLTDFTKNYSVENFATVVIPKGAQLEDETIQGLYSYQTVADGVSAAVQEEYSNYHDEGSIYIYDHDQSATSPINTYGRIETVVEFNDVSSADELLKKGVAYLTDTQFDNLVLEVKAIDLHYLDISETSFKLLDQIYVVSPPHGLTDKLFPLTAMEIDLVNPANTTITLGAEEQLKLTVTTRKANNTVIEKVNKTVVMKESVLAKAQAHATELINNSTGGYVTFLKDPETEHVSSILITDRDYLIDPTGAKGWKWNQDGLGYFPNGFSQGMANLALTSDGAIVAESITTDGLDASHITTGELHIRDNEGNTVFKLNVSDGTLTIGGYSTTADTAAQIAAATTAAVQQADANVSQMMSFNSAVGLKIFGDGSGGSGNNYVLITSTSQSFVVAGTEMMRLDGSTGKITTRGTGFDAGNGSISGSAHNINIAGSTTYWSWTTDSSGTLKLVREVATS